MNALKSVAIASMFSVLIPAAMTAGLAYGVDVQEKTIKIDVKQRDFGVETFEFSKGNADLTDVAKDKMRTLVDNAKKDGGIKKIKVAVWSDQDSPAKTRKDLPKEDRRLAESRGDNIKNYLKSDLDVNRVEVFNMAEGTNWLAEMLGTEGAELREAFANNKYKGKVNPEVLIIRDQGGPSKAVLVLEHEHKDMAH